MTVAGAQYHRDDNRLSGRVPLHRALHLDVIAVVGSDEVGADQQQNDVVDFDMLLNGTGKLLTRTDPPVMPGLDDPAASGGRAEFDLIPQRLVHMGVRKEQARRHTLSLGRRSRSPDAP